MMKIKDLHVLLIGNEHIDIYYTYEDDDEENFLVTWSESLFVGYAGDLPLEELGDLNVIFVSAGLNDDGNGGVLEINVDYEPQVF